MYSIGEITKKELGASNRYGVKACLETRYDLCKRGFTLDVRAQKFPVHKMPNIWSKSKIIEREK